MRFAATALSLVCTLACGSSHIGDDLDEDSGIDRDFGVIEDASPPSDAASDADVPGDSGMDPVRCGGLVCAEGFACCWATGSCFDPRVDACGSGTPSPGRCHSNADCDPDEFCDDPEGLLCRSEGQCRPREMDCGTELEPACGCDGVTYSSRCAAALAGMRSSAAPGACGEGTRPPCGRDEDCGAASECCFITGRCTPADCPECCSEPPEGTFETCRTDSHCSDDDAFCDAPEGMCGGVGGCRSTGGSCDGSLNPVCGCNGSSYTNPCWARVAGTSVASVGECGADGDP